jgi:predicted nucleic acid-binding protein
MSSIRTIVSADATGLLDTSVVIGAAAGLLDLAVVPATVWITTVTLGELSAGPLTARTPDERASRLAVLQGAEAEFGRSALPYDEAAARVYGRVVADVLRAGRRPRRRTADLMIAAVALSRGLTLYTTNAEDFRGIVGLDVVAVRAR